MYKVEKNIKLPEKSSKYPLKEMEKGDSFFVECNANNKKSLRISINNCAANLGVKIATRSVEGGIRIWKI